MLKCASMQEYVSQAKRLRKITTAMYKLFLFNFVTGF